MIRDKYTPIVLSGPSGSGKTELIEYIEQRNPEFQEETSTPLSKPFIYRNYEKLSYI